MTTSAAAKKPAGNGSALAEDHALLIDAVRAAGAVALARFGQPQRSWHKTPHQPVTETDLAVDALLRERLMGARPDYGWVSEESVADTAFGRCRGIWVIDPIDGTRAFMRGRPEFAVAAALVDADGEAVAGVVFNPATEELFEAFRGGGARLNGQTIAVTAAPATRGARILVSRSEFRDREWPAVFAEAEISDLSSIAYKLALVAAGRADAAVALQPKADWDLAAAHIVVSEAGGIVTHADGAKPVYNRRAALHPSVLAAGERLHRRLRAEMAAVAARGSGAPGS